MNAIDFAAVLAAWPQLPLARQTRSEAGTLQAPFQAEIVVGPVEPRLST